MFAVAVFLVVLLCPFLAGAQPPQARGEGVTLRLVSG
jgi:hypothetical protein